MYEAHVIHHIPGRMRIRAPFLKGAAAYSLQINQLLLPIEGLKQVDFSPITGSVLLHYDPELFEQFTERVTEHVQLTLGVKLLRAKANGAEGSNQHTVVTPVIGDTKLTHEIYSFFNRANDQIRGAADNNFDLKSMLPIGLALYALSKVSSVAATPLWITLAIFSFTSFAILNPVSIAVETEEEQVKSSRRNNSSRKKQTSS
jgi:hypothetical protein